MKSFDYLHWTLLGLLITSIVVIIRLVRKGSFSLPALRPAIKPQQKKVVAPSLVNVKGQNEGNVNLARALMIIGTFLLIFSLVLFGKKIKAVLDFKNLTATIEAGGNDQVIITEYPHDLIEENAEGNYYIIDLRDATSKSTLLFAAGQYTIPTFNRDYLSSVNELKRLIRPLRVLDKYQIYVKGSADIKGDTTFSRTFDSCCRYNKITYYRDISKGKTGELFSTQTNKTLELNDILRNRDLPELRASYIADKLKDNNNDLKEPKLLEGKVEPIVGEGYRNVTTFLFIQKRKIPIHVTGSFVVSISLILIGLFRLRNKKKKNK